jgi:hypothetical protein
MIDNTLVRMIDGTLRKQAKLMAFARAKCLKSL